MKLADWRRQNDKTQQDVAEALGCFVTSVARYEAGTRLPDRATMIALYRLSEGAVRPDDFYDLPALAGEPIEQAA